MNAVGSAVMNFPLLRIRVNPSRCYVEGQNRGDEYRFVIWHRWSTVTGGYFHRSEILAPITADCSKREFIRGEGTFLPRPCWIKRNYESMESSSAVSLLKPCRDICIRRTIVTLLLRSVRQIDKFFAPLTSFNGHVRKRWKKYV